VPDDVVKVGEVISYSQRVCVSAANARFSGTIIYAGRLAHGSLGPIEVLGYQNTAVNLDAGPNAMLLHLPAVKVEPEQFLHLGDHTDILTRMARAVEPLGGDPQAVALMENDGAFVFDHDIYTIVLAADATAIPAALQRVPEHRRPVVSPDLFGFYASVFPLHTIALCCFDNRDAVRAKPLMLWYEPLDPQRIVVPAVDCHTGRAPDLAASVRRDHCLVFGTDQARDGWGYPVEYAPGMRHRLRAFLPGRIIGRIVRGDTANGDFAITSEDLLAGRTDRVCLVGV
jgi:hypothetical protein